MQAEELKKRTKDFALRIIKLVEYLPRTKTADVIGRQLLRSATSVGANYRAACRARSRADFVSKICVVEEEADESAYWLEHAQRAQSPPLKAGLASEYERGFSTRVEESLHVMAGFFNYLSKQRSRMIMTLQACWERPTN